MPTILPVTSKGFYYAEIVKALVLACTVKTGEKSFLLFTNVLFLLKYNPIKVTTRIMGITGIRVSGYSGGIILSNYISTKSTYAKFIRNHRFCHC